MIEVAAAGLLTLAALPAAALAGATFDVDTTADFFVGGCTPAPGDCSLRAAIANANSSAGNTIMIPAGNYVLSLPGAGEDADATGDLDVLTSMTIIGAGAGVTTINANGIDRVLDFQNIPAGVWALSGVSVTGGLAGDGNGGAGIRQQAGTLSISNSVIAGNKVMAGGGYGGGGVRLVTGTLNIDTSAIDSNGMTTGEGGGLYTGAPANLNITRSAITRNSAVGNDGGGGIYNQDHLTMVNTTLSANSTDDTGGGLDNHGPAEITNTTIAGNTAGLSGGGINRDSGTVQLENAIVAGNSSPAGTNCSGAIVSKGHNLESADTCGFNAAGDLKNVDPLLGALADNGGPTKTQALQTGSPAIDAADPSACPATDQRGVARPQFGGCDIGAFELAPVPADKTAPTASELAMNPSRFAPTGSGGSVITRKKKVARGTKVSYKLSEAATVAFVVEKQIKGRKKGRKCKVKRKKGKRCTIVKAVRGSFTVQGKQGSNSFKFSGRLNNKKLKRGRYRLVATPTDAAGNRGTAVRKSFNIVR